MTELEGVLRSSLLAQCWAMVAKVTEKGGGDELQVVLHPVDFATLQHELEQQLQRVLDPSDYGELRVKLEQQQPAYYQSAGLLAVMGQPVVASDFVPQGEIYVLPRSLDLTPAKLETDESAE